MQTTYAGMYASDKPRDSRGYFVECEQAPNGEFIPVDQGGTTSDGQYALCDCGEIAPVVSDSEVITRVECGCAKSSTGCRVLAD